MRIPFAKQWIVAVAVAGAIGVPSSFAQRRPATDAEAVSYI